MASKRMFALTIIDSDAFLDMPQSTQLLYFHLGMRADDDGFINNAKTIMRVAGCKEDDLKLLIAKKFVIWFESGIIVIKHWNINNYIQNDRYHETKYKEEKEQLFVDEKGGYTLTNGTPAIDYRDTENKILKKQCIQDVSNLYTQDRLGKDSLDKTRLELDYIKENTKRKNFVKPSVEDVREYCIERNNNVNPEEFYDFYESKGWMVGKNHMKDWKACVRTWERNHINQPTNNYKKSNRPDIELEDWQKESYNNLMKGFVEGE